MTTKRTSAPRSAARRIAAVTVALVALLSAGPAFAAKPEAWPVAHNGSDVSAILKIAGWTIGVYLLIWLVASLPSILRSNKFDESTAFVEQPEWFGGPRDASVAAKAPDENTETGGASANW